MVLKQHIVVDARDCIGDLKNKEKLYYDLIELVHRINMKLLLTKPFIPKKSFSEPINPYVTGAVQGHPLGISANALITDSNIGVHTWLDECLVNYDIFSCRPFSKNVVKSFIKEKYQTNKIKIQNVKRW